MIHRHAGGYGVHFICCGWRFAAMIGGCGYWRVSFGAGPVPWDHRCRVVIIGIGDRWPEASIGSTTWRVGIGEWESGEGMTVIGWGPFWKARRKPKEETT